MGMSASQARYLQLTARKSDLEYEAMQINQAMMALAESADASAKKYNEALENKRLFFVSPLDSTNSANQLLTYNDIVSDALEGGLGMRLVDALGNFVVPAFPEKLDDGAKAGDYLVDEDIKNSEYLDECLRNGTYFLAAYKEGLETGINVWEKQDYGSCRFIRDSYYKDDDAEATATYERETSEIQRKEKMLQLSLKDIETEREAIVADLESVKKVIDKSTDVFKDTFG